MGEQNNLQWFLIKKFIEILAVVGAVEYLLTFVVNRFVLPNILLYFFPDIKKNSLMFESGILLFLFAILIILLLGAFNAIFPSPLHEMVEAALEHMQKSFLFAVSAGKNNFSIYELNRWKAVLLFLVAFVVLLAILLPYVLGAFYFAKITIEEFRQIQKEREEVLDVTQEVKNGRNYLIFPEGTRSRRGNQVGDFKGGSFKCAVKAKAPIVPVALLNAFEPFDRNSIAPVTVQVHFLEPIYYEEYKDLKTTAIAELVRERIVKTIADQEKEAAIK